MKERVGGSVKLRAKLSEVTLQNLPFRRNPTPVTHSVNNVRSDLCLLQPNFPSVCSGRPLTPHTKDSLTRR